MSDLPPIPDPLHIQTRVRVALTITIVFGALWHYVVRPDDPEGMLDVLLGMVFGYWFARGENLRR